MTVMLRIAIVLMLSLGAFPTLSSAQDKPRLILQITVDQLRGDLPMRHLDQFGKGGFRYLMEQGIHYDNAHHTHANTETVVGHTTLATGANPAAHGMVGNLWYDRALGRTVYNIEDPDYSILTSGADVDASTEIDPTQRAAKSDGRSPRAILTSTFSDELALSTAGRGKIFGVSIKDRGAVAMAGHAGKAFWFSKAAGQFVTSNYYYDAYPEWVDAWNAKGLPQSFSGKSWELLNPIGTYIFGDKDDQEWEPDFAGFGRVFPHPLGTAEDKYFTTLLTLSPYGDRMTADFAKTLIDAEELGADDVTDYLSISFSVTDYVGHFFGASSLETEDNLLQLDRTLADLFAHIEAEVGLENTLIVLSADHGAPEAPGYLASLGMPGGYVKPDAWDTAPAAARIKERFGLTGKLFEGYDHPYLTLSAAIRNDPDIDRVALETMIADELVAFEGVAYAVPSSRLRDGALPDNALMQAVLNNYHPERSGDIYVVFQPEWFINDMDGLSVTVTHGSPWRYDTYVPILSELEIERTWDEATDLVIDSLAPLGDEYCTTLRDGLTTARWSDRYPNKGKQSGAFSCGSYDGAPFILMNYKPKVLNDVFTLTHEAGHSMHSYYSAKHQSYIYHDYTIFVAEVASTFNEQLLTDYLLNNAQDDQERAYLINNELDSIRATVVRQTMFAEFEKRTHAMAEAGEPLTVDSYRSVYRELLTAYFGPDFVIGKELELECFRIPHFYRAFYVYKYATGLSAAVALSRRVLEGGRQELDEYLSFLSGGCSKDPLDLLRDAGVDMLSPQPVATTLQRFAELTKELDQLL